MFLFHYQNHNNTDYPIVTFTSEIDINDDIIIEIKIFKKVITI